jgi:esterase/lipase
MFIQNKFMRIIFILFIAMVLSAFKGTLESRHNPSGIKIPLPENDFGKYIDETRERIKKATSKENLKDEWIEKRLPFRHKPDDTRCADSKPYKGALLIHGLTDSPFIMGDLRDRFKDKCYWVRSILLPGHGTIPGDLVNVDYSEWVEAIDAGIDSFKDKVEELYLVGFSTGTSLALHHVLRKNNPTNIKGLILLAPGIKEKTPIGFAAGSIAGLGRIIPKMKFLFGLHQDEDKVKYESFAINAGAQFHDLTKSLSKLADKKPHITIPTFMAISSVDATVDPDCAGVFFCNELKNSKNRMIWYTAKEKKYDPKETCEGFTVKRIKNHDEGILDYAHLSLPVHPENEYYGRNGKYKSCLTYSKSNIEEEQDDPNYRICKNEKIGKENSLMYGEHTSENKKEYVVRRLTFNPMFDDMMKDIFDFIKSIEHKKKN